MNSALAKGPNCCDVGLFLRETCSSLTFRC